MAATPLRELTNLGFVSFDREPLKATPPRRPVLELRTPDAQLLLPESSDVGISQDDITRLHAEIASLRAEKAALTVLGRGFFAAQIQCRVRGFLVRSWCACASTSALLLQAVFRGELARAVFRRARVAATTVAATYRAATLRRRFEALRGATVAAQKYARLVAGRSRYVALRKAAVAACTRVRGTLSRARRRRALKAATSIAAAYRGRSVRRLDPKRAARAFHEGAVAKRLVGLLLNPPRDAVVLGVCPGSPQVEATLKPDGQPFGLSLPFDPATGDLSLIFSFNPRGDLRHVLAPWLVRGSVVVKILNQKKLGKDKIVFLDTIQPHAHYTNLFKRTAAFTVGVQRLLTKAQLQAEFYCENRRTVVVSVVNQLHLTSSPSHLHHHTNPTTNFAYDTTPTFTI